MIGSFGQDDARREVGGGKWGFGEYLHFCPNRKKKTKKHSFDFQLC